MNLSIIDHVAQLTIGPDEINAETYQSFLATKELPRQDIGRDIDSGEWRIEFPAEYASRLGQEYTPEKREMPLPLPDFLFDRQRVAIQASWHKKRYALFWDAGLGKTLVFLELARQLTSIGKKALIISPLNIIHQTAQVADEFYGDLMIQNFHGDRDALRKWQQSPGSQVVGIVNHMAFRRPLNLDGIDAVFVDESSILKTPHGRIRTNLINACLGMEYKYLYSATQAPNERIEYAQSAVFLEIVRSDTAFRAMFFVQKDQGWVLRHHGVEKFYENLASWSMFMRSPETYGLEPCPLPLYKEIQIEVGLTPEQVELATAEMRHEQPALPGMPARPNGFVERGIYSQISKGFRYMGKNGKRKVITVPTLKTDEIVQIAKSHLDRKAIVWTVFDEEGEIITSALESQTDLRVAHLTGKTPIKRRVKAIVAFQNGEIDVVVSKTKILGMGLNLHIANLVIFSGVSDSYEAYYQAIKRSWRYPQDQDVLVYLPYTVYEKAMLDNVLRKRDQAERDYVVQERLYAESSYDEIKDYLTTDWTPAKKEKKEMLEPIITEDYELWHTDSIAQTLGGWEPNSFDLIVTSIPFRNDLFAYTDSPSDMGNSGGVGQAGRDEFMLHLAYSLQGMFNVLKPGRMACIEISQSPLRLGVDGVIGMSDFRGDLIRAAEEIGFTTFAEIPVLGNPQADAIVKHITTLTMSNFNKDRCNLAPMILDYILVFKKPGVNETPVLGSDFGTFESWIEHADGIWQAQEHNEGCAQYEGISQAARFAIYMDQFEIAFKEAMQVLAGGMLDISQSVTLNTPYTRGKTKELEDADKHVCPFSLQLVNRLVRLYSNPGDRILDPFVGVGSVLQEAIKLGRYAAGLELKAEYFVQAGEIANRAVEASSQARLL